MPPVKWDECGNGSSAASGRTNSRTSAVDVASRGSAISRRASGGERQVAMMAVNVS
jgi:hypothetical protein